MTYCPSPTLANFTCDACRKLPGADALRNVTVITNGKLQLLAFVASRPADDSVVVSFRGTVDGDIMNWIKDAGIVEKAPWSELKGVKVHGGFYSSWSALKGGVFAAISRLLPPDGRVHLTGHSLGASMATLCAFELAKFNGTKLGHVITFGQPRTGNKAFASAYNAAVAEHYRLTHHKDPVPQFPWPALGYHHTKHEVFYSEANELVAVCDGSGEDPKCQDQYGVNCLQPSDHTSYLNTTTGSSSCAS